MYMKIYQTYTVLRMIRLLSPITLKSIEILLQQNRRAHKFQIPRYPTTLLTEAI
jgi:hypothetical protein